jgi:hypothetical protein
MSPNLESLGKWLLVLGFVIIVVGGALWGIGKLFGWEKFPGTLRIQSGNATCLFPILGSILLSILLTIALNLLARFLNR